MKKLFLFIICAQLYASSLDLLLNKIEKTNDLSLQTKQEAAGISYVITRYQLDMMQAKTLNDVLKNTAISNFSNRYNLLDPFALTMSPFGNNNIKVFIDNFEITSMSSENSVFLFSNLNLDFVDHIEIYYFSSADKYFGEPTYAVIKLYSKNPQRDNGITTKLGFSSKSNSQSLGYGDYKDTPFFLYTSRMQVIDHSIVVDTKKVSKDSKTYHFFAKMQKGDNNFIFNSIIDKRDGFLGMSLDGEPDESYVQNKQFLIGYDRNYEKVKINYTLNYQSNLDKFSQDDKPLFQKDNENIYSMYTKGDNFTNYLKLEFPFRYFSGGFLLKNEKNFNIDYKINGEQSYKGIKNQTKYTTFIDKKYQYLENYILNMSFSYSLYDNDVVDNYHLKNFKLGNTYLYNKSNIFKLYYFHIENIPPNYLVNSIFQNSALVPTTTNSYIFKYKRKMENNEFFITYITGDSKNQIIYKNNGLENDSSKVTLNFVDVRWSTNYNYINNLMVEVFGMFVNNSSLKQQKQIAILNTHRYKKFDFFENIIYKKVITNHKNEGFDLDLGIKYNASDNLTISLKGTSLLSSRYENEYIRYDVLTKQQLSSFYYPATSRNISVDMEYCF